MPTNKSVSFGGVFTQSQGKKHDSKPPSIKERFNCGVLRTSLRLVKSNSMHLMSLGLVGSKLRKREDHGAEVTPTNHNNNNNVILEDGRGVPTATRLQQVVSAPAVISHPLTLSNSNGVVDRDQNQQQLPPYHPPLPDQLPFLWTLHSSHYNMSNSSQDTLVTSLTCEEVSECKGFKKTLGGKWRRLLKKKPQQEVYTIPAELRPQLKQIYVY